MYGSNEYGSIPYGSNRGSYQNNTKALTDNHTLSDSIQRSRSRRFLDIQTLTDLIRRAITRIRLETATVTDLMRKSSSRFFHDLFSGFTDDMDTSKGRGLEYFDTMNTSDSIKRDVTRNLLDITTITDILGSIRNRFSRFVDSFAGLLDSLTSIRTKHIDKFDTIHTSDKLQKSMTRSLIDSPSLSDLISRSKGYVRSMLDTSTLSDSMSKIRGRVFIDVANLSERFIRILNGSVISGWIKKAKATISYIFSGKASATTFTKTPKATSIWTKTSKPDSL